MNRRSLLSAALLMPAVFVTASRSDSFASATTTTAGPVPRFTGLIGDDPVLPDRPALGVKIDDFDNLARPQAGVRQAAVLYDEIGSGAALGFVEGRSQKGRWGPDNASQVTRYVVEAGSPLPLTPGQTWVMLAKPGIASVQEAATETTPIS